MKKEKLITLQLLHRSEQQAFDRWWKHSQFSVYSSLAFYYQIYFMLLGCFFLYKPPIFYYASRMLIYWKSLQAGVWNVYRFCIVRTWENELFLIERTWLVCCCWGKGMSLSLYLSSNDSHLAVKWEIKEKMFHAFSVLFNI